MELIVNGDRSSQTRTDWSMIFDAASDETGTAEQAIEQLARRYWPAVYAYIRRSGRDVHEAADLTQGFICDVVIERKLFSSADPERGRFRTLLLNALQNYLRDAHRRTANTPGTKESNSTRMVTSERIAQIDPDAGRSPTEAFDAQWTTLLISSVVEQVREQCQHDGLEPHWQVFEARVVRPMLFGDEPTAYDALIDRLDLKDAAQASNMMVTVKRRFARQLYDEIGRTVSDPVFADGELHHLMKSLEGGS